MQEVVSFLHEHTNEAITIDIQADDGTKEANELKLDLKSALDKLPTIKEHVFDYQKWTYYSNRSTVEEMVARNQRVVITINKFSLAGILWEAESYEGETHIMTSDDVSRVE